MRALVPAVVLALLVACGGTDENKRSNTVDPTQELTSQPPATYTGFPPTETDADTDADTDSDADTDTTGGTDTTPTETGTGTGTPAGFDLVFEGQGFNPHDGQTMYVSVNDTVTFAQVAADDVVVAGGVFSFTFPGILATGGTYSVSYFADVDGDGLCSAPPADHVWQEAIPAVAGDVNLQVAHSVNFKPGACAAF